MRPRPAVMPLPVRVAIGLVGLAGIVIALLAGDLISLVYYAPFAIVGTVLTIRRPRTLVGWLLLLLGWPGLLATLRVTADPEALAAGTAPLLEELVAWFAHWGWSAVGVVLVALILELPEHRLSRGPKFLTVALLGTAVTCCLLVAFGPSLLATSLGPSEVPNPFALLPGHPFWALIPGKRVLTAVGLGSVAVAGAVLIARYRRSRGIERLQLRWILFGLTAFATTALIATALAAVNGVGPDVRALGWLAPVIVFVWWAVPGAIGIAVIRYRLYQIDRLISRTITWALVTVAVLIIFVGGNLALQAVLENATQGGTLAVAASTLLAFAAAQPIWRRVQRSVDRRFDRARFDAAEMATAFADRQRDRVDLGAVLTDLTDTSRTALRPATMGIWLRGHDRAGRR